jgi:hypothetical protein
MADGRLILDLDHLNLGCKHGRSFFVSNPHACHPLPTTQLFVASLVAIRTHCVRAGAPSNSLFASL